MGREKIMSDRDGDAIEATADSGGAGWSRGGEQSGGTATTVAPPLSRRSSRDKNPARADATRPKSQPASRPADPGDGTAAIHAVVVAGDHGWGGDAFGEISCRPLLELAGRSIIAHGLDWLSAQGIRSAAVCANSNTSAVRRHLGDGREFGLSLDYYCDVMPRGPAGCFRDAAVDCDAETFLMLSGMIVPRIGITDAVRHHRSSRSLVTVVACPGAAGSLEPTGMYLFSREVLDRIAPTGYQDIKETLLPHLRRLGGRVGMFRVHAEQVLRVTDLESYMRANRIMICESLDAVCGSEYLTVGQARVHRACVIHPSVRIIGPAIIGPGCTLEADVVVVGPTSIGTGCHLEQGAVVSRSTFWSFCRAGRNAVVDNCLLAQRTDVPAGQELRDTFWTGRRPADDYRTIWSPTWLPKQPAAVRVAC